MLVLLVEFLIRFLQETLKHGVFKALHSALWSWSYGYRWGRLARIDKLGVR